MQGTIVETILDVNDRMSMTEDINLEEKEGDLDKRARRFIEEILKKMFVGDKMTPVVFSSKNGFWDSQLLHKAYYMANKYGMCSMMKLGEDFGYAYEFWYGNK